MYLFEQIESPVSELGLVHFADLLIRHQNLLEGKSKVVNICLDNFSLYDDMFGNNFFLSKHSDKVVLGRIVRKGASTSLVKQIFSIGAPWEYRYILFEPFILRQDDAIVTSGFHFEVAFAPSCWSNVSSDKFRAGLKADKAVTLELPHNVDCGNFNHSTRRILPAISKKLIKMDQNCWKVIFTLHLIEITCAIPSEISITKKCSHILGEGMLDEREEGNTLAGEGTNWPYFSINIMVFGTIIRFNI